mgnify:CR=1 FL=1
MKSKLIHTPLSLRVKRLANKVTRTVNIHAHTIAVGIVDAVQAVRRTHPALGVAAQVLTLGACAYAMTATWFCL